MKTCAKGIEFTLTRNAYSDNENTYLGLISRKNGFIEPFDDLTANLGVPLPKNMAYIHVIALRRNFSMRSKSKGLSRLRKDAWGRVS